MYGHGCSSTSARLYREQLHMAHMCGRKERAAQMAWVTRKCDKREEGKEGYNLRHLILAHAIQGATHHALLVFVVCVPRLHVIPVRTVAPRSITMSDARQQKREFVACKCVELFHTHSQGRGRGSSTLDHSLGS